MSSTTKSSSTWSHNTVCVNGHKLTVVDFGYDRFLIGAQVAQILARETFNMYRSMKIKRINIRRANPAEVAYLVRAEAVRIGTHSITLIPEALGLYFIADATVGAQKQCSNCECCAIRELSALKTKSFLVTKPKLHRRKALPWNIHRSLRKEDLDRIHSEGFSRVPSSASPSASPLRSSNSSLISRSSSPFEDEAPLSRSSSPVSDSSISSSSSSSSLLEALTTYAGSPVAQDLTITFDVSTREELDSMQQEKSEQEQEEDTTTTIQYERPVPPPLSPLSPSHSSSSSSDSDSLPEASPERVVPRKSPLLLPTFDRPLYCGFPISGSVSSTPAASSFLMYSASY